MIKEFKGKYRWLSNFYNSPVTYNGITYQNNEAAFQAQKTFDENIRLEFANLNPSEAKRKGRKVKLRSDWEEVKDKIMYEIVKAKFTQSEKLRNRLLNTGFEELVEGTTGWHDNYWGNCECEKCKHIEGKNKLGQILMTVRDNLRP